MAPSVLLPEEIARDGVSVHGHVPLHSAPGNNGIISSFGDHDSLNSAFSLPSSSDFVSQGLASENSAPDNFELSNGLLVIGGPAGGKGLVSEQNARQSSLHQSNRGTRHSITPKPNILYIMADQMAAPLLKIHDPNSPIKTPNIDSLAKSGVVFTNAYCNSPLCAPSRFSMCTGQLPSKIKGYDNASVLNSDIPTYAHYLRQEGYETALAGKMHFIGPDQLHGFESRLTSDIYPGDLGWTVNWDKPDERQEWYHNMSSVMQAGPCIRSNQLDYDEDVMHKASQYLYDHVRQGPDARPFALTVSLTHPHDPYTMTEEYWNQYEDVDIPLPKLRIPQDEQDPHSVRLLKAVDLWNNPVPDEAVKRARRAYFGACTFVDDQVGKLLRILKNCRLEKNTIIVFSGDHGDMLGERDMWYKMSWFEMSARVPLIVNYPSQFEPKRVHESVSTMDLLPTFVDLAGGNTEAILPVDGKSLYNYLITDQPGRDEVFGEYMGEGTISPVMMIRRGKWKYVTSLVDPPQLFDLVSDPLEIVNLAASSKEEYNRIAAEFEKEAHERWDFKRIHYEVLVNQRQRRLCWTALTKGRFESWDYQPVDDQKKKYIRSQIPLDDLERRARFPVVDYLGREHTAAATHHGIAGACGE
ncbi:choline sulfatase [Lepidopterella palustris CBS 459.81]|uniref:Choline sulfatase n=1 Tax=Lepidopterella palustris CBS 459.81 TaxID=1314670 RepID=A0A8E2EEG3_9PEZI|nr:choline sulfatase [Lepidopterella palustris CBS 459.81]